MEVRNVPYLSGTLTLGVEIAFEEIFGVNMFASSIRRALLGGVLASSLALSGSAAFAQDAATPETDDAAEIERRLTINNAEGQSVGFAVITDSGSDVTVSVSNTSDSGLEAGDYGIHIHEFGSCLSDNSYEAAGGHFNPHDVAHGGPEDEESHAGDLGNLTVEDDGTFELEVTRDDLTLEPDAEASLNTENGAAILIHSEADDLETDPDGDSGDPMACGVIYPMASGPGAPATPAATLEAPDATPEMDEMEMDATPEVEATPED